MRASWRHSTARLPLRQDDGFQHGSGRWDEHDHDRHSDSAGRGEATMVQHGHATGPQDLHD